MTTALSKSRLLSGLQCPKRLWLEVEAPELAARDPQAEARMATGRQVGELARRQFPGGVLLDAGGTLGEAVARTARLLRGSPPPTLYEATFAADDVLVRADILAPGERGLVLHEVKATASVKPCHHQDCAIQSWVIEAAGHPLERIHLTHIDTAFVYRREGDYTGLFQHADLTDEVRALQGRVPDWVRQCRQVLAGPCPQVAVGPQCKSPFECPFLPHCDNAPGPDHPVTELPGGGRIKQQLIDEGIIDIRDIPEGRLTNPLHVRIREAVVSGRPFHDPQVRAELEAIRYPRFYIDFETVAFAVPRWLGTRPYQQLPFQWSCHIEHAGGRLEHHEFLDTGSGPPMRAFTDSLLAVLDDASPVLVYNAAFERKRLEEMAALFPDRADRIAGVIDRIVDLLPLVRRYYYHPDMHGSWSLKAVLPVLAPDLDYSRLAGVHDGSEAQLAYLALVDPATATARRRQLSEQLRAYCKLDTLAMVRIARRLVHPPGSHP